jgi:hypothetical protein
MADDELLAFLQARDAPYCLRCLARAFPFEPIDERLKAGKRGGAPLLIGEGRCAMCTQTTTVVAWVTGDPDLVRLGR